MSQYTVIIVDDEEYILQSLRRLFHCEPYKIIFTSSGADALKLITEATDVAVIISDQRMPMMKGSEFLAHSRKIVPDAIRMLLTGYSDKEATELAMTEGGASMFISKPWDGLALIETLRDGVRQFIENKQ